jgi:hypothetical protein
VKKFTGFWRNGFYKLLIADLTGGPSPAGLFNANSLRGNPTARGLNAQPLLLRRLAYLVFGGDIDYHDALVWKLGLLSGAFRRVLAAVQDRPLVVVGPPHLADWPERIGHRNARHVALHPTDAMSHAGEVLRACRDVLEPHRGARPRPVVFLQAGPLAHWLVYRLHEDPGEVFLLDVGRALDVWYPEVVAGQAWWAQNSDRIHRRMRLTAPT